MRNYSTDAMGFVFKITYLLSSILYNIHTAYTLQDHSKYPLP